MNLSFTTMFWSSSKTSVACLFLSLLTISSWVGTSMAANIDDGHKHIVFFAGPHYARALDVDTFFSRNRFDPVLREWLWPRELGPMAQSLNYHSGRDIFRHLVLEAHNETLQQEMLASLQDQWEQWDAKGSYDMKGMILGTEEFDRVGDVPYSGMNGIDAMTRVVNAINFTDSVDAKPGHVTVIINYVAPRMDQWIQVFMHERIGVDHYKEFICSKHDENGDYEMIWETLDTAMNPLKLAVDYRDLGWNVVLIDLSGVDAEKRDISHVIACDVLGVPCDGEDHPPGWVDGLYNVTYDLNVRQSSLPSLDNEKKTQLERLFRRRDCAFKPLLEYDRGVTIVSRNLLWADCETERIPEDLEPLLRDTTAVFGAIRSQKGCGYVLGMDDLLHEKVRTTSPFMKAVMIVLLGIIFFFAVKAVYEYRFYREVRADDDVLEPHDRIKKASQLRRQKEAEELLVL